MVAVLFVSAALPLSANGRKDVVSADTVKAGVFRPGDFRTLSAFVVGSPAPGSKEAMTKYAENMYVPQAAAAYFPTKFIFSEKERRLVFLTDFSYRIVKKHDLGQGVTVYTVEAAASAQDREDGKRYIVSFPRTALGPETGESVQPAPYALERGARMSGLKSGTARLESFGFDPKTGLFRAQVIAVPEP